MGRKGGKRAKYQTTKVKLYSGNEIKVYASPRVYEALSELSDDLTIYKGVRLAQLLEAVYTQGKKDGAREAFEVTEAIHGCEETRATSPTRST